MTRLDPYSASLREEQKAILNGLLGLIYDNYDTTRRIESTVNSIYRITIALLVIVVLLVVGIIVFVCILGCRKYQSESGSATQHVPLKTFREQRRPEHHSSVTEKLMRHHPPQPQSEAPPPSSSSQEGFADAPAAQVHTHRNLNVNPRHPGPMRHAQTFEFETLHR